jgi:DNA-binding PadR family transcriptional regulator
MSIGKKKKKLDQYHAVDFRDIQRSLLPFVVLKLVKAHQHQPSKITELKQFAQDELNELFDNDYLISAYEGYKDMYYAHYGAVFNIIKFFIEQNYVINTKDGKYLLTENGTALLKQWSELISNINSILPKED